QHLGVPGQPGRQATGQVEAGDAEVGPDQVLTRGRLVALAEDEVHESLAAGMAAAHLSASSRSGQSMIVYPPTCSRSSAAGPSVRSTRPSRTPTGGGAGVALRRAQATS